MREVRLTYEATMTATETETLSVFITSLIQPETVTAKPERRRANATYCPICAGWVEVRLQPVRLRCTGCGIEARP